MKTKLTITVEDDLVPVAKRYAAEHGVSLSSLIEDSLRRMVEGGDAKPGFARRWRGRFDAADRDDARYRALAEKYL